jgi:hypothetical protein
MSATDPHWKPRAEPRRAFRVDRVLAIAVILRIEIDQAIDSAMLPRHSGFSIAGKGNP